MKTSMSDRTPDRSSPERILQRLEWQVIRRLDGLLQGDYRSMFYGYGVDFADLREYQPEDDIRYIDWNVTARMNTPYVRQYIEDREITAWFLLDLSASMDFGNSQNVKQAVLIDFVATFARLLTRHGNRIGALLYTGQGISRSGSVHAGVESAKRGLELVIPAAGGRNHVLRIINELVRYAQPKQESRKASVTNLATLIEGGLHVLKKRSLVFIISDFFSTPGWERPLRMLNQRHEVLGIRVVDPRELELPNVGPIIVEDAESGEQVYVDTHDKGFRTRFQEAVKQHQAALHSTFSHAGVDLLEISTDDDLVRSIMRFASLRKQRLGRRTVGAQTAGGKVFATKPEHTLSQKTGKMSEAI
jgi:uncharacterized protein (DUF58 family)